MKGFTSLSKYEVSLDKYHRIVSIQNANNTLYSEQLLGSRRTLFINGNLIATTVSTNSLDIGCISKQQFYSFLGLFSRGLYGQFSKNPELFNLDIPFTGVARSRNYLVWDSLKAGHYFYNVDLSSAYWQIAFKLGYIPKSLFDSFLHVDSYKESKRYCISFLGRSSRAIYRVSNNDLGIIYHTVSCDTRPLKRVYDNIRNHLYSCIQGSIFGIGDYVEYNIDGVSVLAKDLDLVRSRFKGLGLCYKITECRKLSDYEYRYGCKLKLFKNANVKQGSNIKD